MNYTEKGTYTYNGEVIEYHYSPTATYSEQSAFVSVVSNNVFVDGSYLPLLKDIMFDFTLVLRFTDIDFSNINDVDDFAEFNKATGIVEDIKANLDSTMLQNLVASVDANIEYKRHTVQDGVSKAVTELIATLTDKIANVLICFVGDFHTFIPHFRKD